MKVQIQRIKRWNRYDFLPYCEISKQFLALVGSSRKRKAFMPRDIRIIANIGFDIEYVNKEGEIDNGDE